MNNKKIETLLKDTLMDNLGMSFTIIDDFHIEGVMPVDKRTVQHRAFLHGGASLAFAETLAGIGSDFLCKDGEIAVGMQISGSHVAPVRGGEGVEVIGRAELLHKGRTTHLWNINIFDKNNKLISTVRVTNSIVKLV